MRVWLVLAVSALAAGCAAILGVADADYADADGGGISEGGPAVDAATDAVHVDAPDDAPDDADASDAGVDAIETPTPICDGSAPASVLVAHTGATTLGEPAFVAALGNGLAWAGAPAKIFYCAQSNACDADGGTLPVTFSTSAIKGLTAGSGVSRTWAITARSTASPSRAATSAAPISGSRSTSRGPS